jgi:hypothetical protein
MTGNDVVEAVVCITSIKRSGDLVINGRVVDVKAKISAEKALINSTIEVRYNGIMLQNMVLKVGILFRVSIPLEVANSALDKIAEGADHVISIEPELIRPMSEPSVRVPLSLLRELRGQELGTEMSRRALVKAWAEDRRTGKSS